MAITAIHARGEWTGFPARNVLLHPISPAGDANPPTHVVELPGKPRMAIRIQKKV